MLPCMGNSYIYYTANYFSVFYNNFAIGLPFNMITSPLLLNHHLNMHNSGHQGQWNVMRSDVLPDILKWVKVHSTGNMPERAEMKWYQTLSFQLRGFCARWQSNVQNDYVTIAILPVLCLSGHFPCILGKNLSIAQLGLMDPEYHLCGTRQLDQRRHPCSESAGMGRQCLMVGSEKIDLIQQR